jgi:hypothetical protein
VPSLVDLGVINAIKDRSIEVVPAVEGVDGATACLVDGTMLEVDAVICATGYRPASAFSRLLVASDTHRVCREAVQTRGQTDREGIARRMILRSWRKGAIKPRRQRRINAGGSGAAGLFKRGGAGLRCQRRG